MLKIPERLKLKIENGSDLELNGYVSLVCHKYEKLLTYNNMEFFEEYTNHSILHINDLLKSVDNLIPDESLDLLSSLDIVLLINSVIYHDIGMHLNITQFNHLISEKKILLPEFDDKCWNELWSEYLIEAKRFNEDQLMALFGDKKKIIKTPDFDNINKHDKLLISEFIRRHHPRLAHEISIVGLTLQGNHFQIEEILDKSYKDLGGVIARSHGMNMRNTFGNLKSRFHESWKTPYNIKIVYLMSILRIADYIQIDSNRASDIILQSKKFLSPYSKNEWKMHNSIEYVSTNMDDPERIYVHCNPKESGSFLKSVNLFKSIQEELDLTWAILGEVYGNSKFKDLKLKYRRITSNLDNVKNFSKTIDYLPKKVTFKTDPNVLKLLIKPLYQNKSKYAVRELIQNSIDACKEREIIDKFEKRKIRISVLQEKEKIYFTIKDNGIGMNSEILINNFFTAGSSHRTTDVWKNQFTKEGISIVNRTGKFGVGVLASFILGDLITVKTRRVGSEVGLEFNCCLNDDLINVQKNKKIEIGTEIRVELNDDIVRLLTDVNSKSKFLWFTTFIADVGYIEYEIDKKFKDAFVQIPQQNLEPDFEFKSHALWRSFDYNSNMKVYYTFDDLKKNAKTINIPKSKYQHVSYNGFVVENGYKLSRNDFPWIYPRIAIMDNNSDILLSLDRNSLFENRLPFEEKLINRICIDLLAMILSLKFESIGDLKYLKEYPNFKKKINWNDHIYCNENGYVFNSRFILEELSINTIWHFWLKSTACIKTDELFLNDKGLYQIHRASGLLSDEEILVLHPTDGNRFQYWFTFLENVSNSKSNLSRELIHTNSDLKKVGKNISLDESLIEESARDSLELEKISTIRKQLFHKTIPTWLVDKFINFPYLIEQSEEFYSIWRSNFGCEKVFYFKLFEDYIKKYLDGKYIIPYDYEARKSIYSGAFNDFGDLIENYRKGYE